MYPIVNPFSVISSSVTFSHIPFPVLNVYVKTLSFPLLLLRDEPKEIVCPSPLIETVVPTRVLFAVP